MKEAGADQARRRAVLNGLLRGAEAFLRDTHVLERAWRPALEAVGDWIRCPCAEHVGSVIATWGPAREIDRESLYGVAVMNIGMAFRGSPIGMEVHVPLAMHQLRRVSVHAVEALVAAGASEQILTFGDV